MKFCPYCGASIRGGAASFCSECGRPLRKSKPKQQTKPPQRQNKKPAAPRPPQRRPKNPLDENYDGYYNDVQPIDADRIGERIDPKMVRQVIWIVAGAIGIIALASVLMLLL